MTGDRNQYGTGESQFRVPQSEIRNHLPGWWRHVLVALATLILCSCRAPTLVPPTDSSAAHEAHVTKELTPSIPAESPIALAAWETTPTSACPSCATSSCDSCGPGPLVGPSDEYLCDGGDFGLPAGVRADWTVNGLEQEDAIGHYDTIDGRVVVQPTNRVCIYAPRFAAVRRVEGVAAHERRQLVEIVDEQDHLIEADETTPVVASLQRHKVAMNLGERPPELFRAREQAGGTENLLAAMDAYGGLAPYCDLSVVRTGQLTGDEKPLVEKAVQAAITWTGDQAAQVLFENKQAVANVQVEQVGTVYRVDQPNSPRLRIIKMASTGHALPGEEVEFTLRFDNVGDQVMGNVTIVDNLATRLEYVPDSAKSTVYVKFSAEPNGAGSSVLRWEIRDPLRPGQGGVLQFRTRVR